MNTATMNTVDAENDLFMDIPTVQSTTVIETILISSTRVNSIAVLTSADRSILATFLFDDVFQHVTDPMRFNRSSAVINSNTINGTADTQDKTLSWSDAHRLAVQMFIAECKIHGLALLPKVPTTPKARLIRSNNARAYKDMKLLIEPRLKQVLNETIHRLQTERRLLAEKEKASRIATQKKIDEAHQLEIKKIQEAEHANAAKVKEAEIFKEDQSRIRANLMNIAAEFADEEW